MRDRWFSRRAVSLHLAVLIFVPGCAVAAWWQVTRAADGNQLSYLYMVMWPIFGLLGIFFWWLLVHTDYDTVGLKGMRNRETSPLPSPSPSPSPQPSPQLSPHGEPAASVPVGPAEAASPSAEDLDPDLAAYNARLAELAKEGPKTWRRPERVVARRTSR